MVEALARADDLATSHAAAASMNNTLPEVERIVFDALSRAGSNGLTVDELADAVGMQKVTVSPRLRPLVRKGLVVETAKRPGASGRQQTVWAAIQ